MRPFSDTKNDLLPYMRSNEVTNGTINYDRAQYCITNKNISFSHLLVRNSLLIRNQYPKDTITPSLGRSSCQVTPSPFVTECTPEVLKGITGYDLVLVSQLRISKKAYLSENSDHFGSEPNFGG
jgi:hypothetical protein